MDLALLEATHHEGELAIGGKPYIPGREYKEGVASDGSPGMALGVACTTTRKTSGVLLLDELCAFLGV